MNDNKNTTKGLFARILFLILWIGILILIVDGFGYFSVMADKLGYIAAETILWLLVLIPAIPVARYAWRLSHHH